MIYDLDTEQVILISFKRTESNQIILPILLYMADFNSIAFQ